MTDWTQMLSRFREQTVLIVGDVMLDTYIRGAVSRVSPEAPVPIVEVSRREDVPGGAANLAANIVGLGGKALLLGVVGDDESANRLAGCLRELGISDGLLVKDVARPTTTKTRVVTQNHQVARFDSELRSAVGPEIESQLFSHIESQIGRVHAVVISDYAKGLVTARVAQKLIQSALAAHKPIVVDPKGSDYSKYRGATIITPNVREAELALGDHSFGQGPDVETLGRKLLAFVGVGAVLITQGADGASLFEPTQPTFHIPATQHLVFDVTGAGDTVVAALALAAASGVELGDAAFVANVAAGLAVVKPGTKPVLNHELSRALAVVGRGDQEPLA